MIGPWSAIALAAGVCAWPSAPRPAERLAAVRPAVARQPEGVRRGLALAALASAPVLLLLHPPWWLVLPGLLVVAIGAFGRRRPPPATDLPLVIELIASCLSAGALLPTAVEAAMGAASPPRREQLRDIASRLRSGDPPPDAWCAWLDDPQLAAVARACIRSTASGAGVAAELTRAAHRLRTAGAAESQRRLAAASVWVVLPLGLCFLPAFVLVGVVPVVVGLFSAMS